MGVATLNSLGSVIEVVSPLFTPFGIEYSNSSLTACQAPTVIGFPSLTVAFVITFVISFACIVAVPCTRKKPNKKTKGIKNSDTCFFTISLLLFQSTLLYHLS